MTDITALKLLAAVLVIFLAGVTLALCLDDCGRWKFRRHDDD